MKKKLSWLVAPFLLFSLVACMCSGLSQLGSVASGLQSAASQLPGMLTSMPTELGPMETMSAQQNSPSGTYTPGHLDISLDQVKSVLQMTQSFTFTDGTINGQPASTAKLTGAAAAAYPDIAAGFSADFIGDPTNLTRIRITLPRTDTTLSAQQGLSALTLAFSSFLPSDITLTLIPWLTQNYSTLNVGDKTSTTINNYIFTLQRDPKQMVLTVDPAQ